MVVRQNIEAHTREDLSPAGLIVAQVKSDNLDTTETRSTADEEKNSATSENADDTISTVATNEQGVAGDYRQSAEESVVPEEQVQPLSLSVDLKHAALQQETSADDASV
jgi:hypothetical protein